MSHKPTYPRVLFILKRRGVYNGLVPSSTPVVSSGLGNSARFVVEMLAENGVQTDLVYVTDANDIHREAVKFKADIVVIEAFWAPPSKFDELKKVLPRTTFVIRNHSETPFLANEGIAFGWIMEHLKQSNVVLGCNSLRMLDDTALLAQLADPCITKAQLLRKVVFMPNYYPFEECDTHRIDPDCDVLNIGCFGSIRPLKNQMIQALGALKFAAKIGKKLRFHINAGRVEQKGDSILKNLQNTFDALPGHELVNHGWMDHAEFRRVLTEMDLCLQVSLTESFNIVAADSITLGIPTVVSPEIRWAAACYMAQPTDTDDIAKVLDRAYHMHRVFPRLNPNLRGLKRYNRDSIQSWLDVLRIEN